MTENQQKPFWNIFAAAFHVIGAFAAIAAASAFGDRESLDSLIFMIPTYAIFCFLALVSASISVLKRERLAALSYLVLVVSVIFCLWSSVLIASHWNLGLEYWKNKLSSL